MFSNKARTVFKFSRFFVCHNSNSWVRYSTVKIRPARHEDYGELMQMGDLLGGWDYLPFMFHRLLDDQDVRALVALQEEKPAACNMIHFVDGGETFCSRASRNPPELRGKGLYLQFLNYHVKNYISNVRPPPKRMGICTTNILSYHNSLLIREGFREVLRRGMLGMRYRRPQVKVFSESRKPTVLTVKEITNDDAKALLGNKALIGDLFPHGIYLDNMGLGYRIMMECNLKLFINDFCSVFASSKQRNTPSLLPGRGGRNFCPDMLSQVDMLSGSRVHHLGSRSLYTCEIYCTEDTSSLEAHIVHHVTRMRGITPGDGVLLLNFPNNISIDDVTSILAELGIKDRLAADMTQFLWYEKDLLA